MDFTLGLVTGMYAVLAVIVFYVVYVIEVKLDLPAIVNGHTNNNNNNNNADSELADLSQTRLRSLIETIIAETLRSSSLSASGAVSEISLDTRSHVSELANGNGLKRRHRTEHYFEPKIYQDLLATAVLNKIADKEGNTRLVAESTPDLSGRHIDENFNAEALSTTSGSSIEPRSDCSLTDHEIGLDNGKSQSLQTDLERESVLSDYIAAHMVPLPDFSASVTESEDDIGSISSGMIGDGNWEDNWLFKKKRSSATPSSIGMLVPAPRENVRAQIGDKTTDEVSDLSEMGSDIEESSLDLLRCNDLNDRLLSKHLIGGQNTKLVLDELVDRTSLTSHTLLEENEPAFTETTNEFVVSPMAMPSDIKAPSPTPPPPPMIFQDDLLNEEPEHTPIAAHGESEELSSLDGCTGFSTVEYIDEGQMHDTVPSVIEILAAMALGPMLAVPASEQPGGMTPSEMHTLKELSDLALAEINARTVDLVHVHSLDIIEEEYTEPSEAAPEQHVDFVQHPPLEESTSTDQSFPGDQECVVQMDVLPPPPQLKLISEIEPPPTIELVQDIKSTATDPQYPAEAVPELATEIVSEMNTDDVTPLEAVQIVPELTYPSDIVPEVQSNVETINVNPRTESEVVLVSLPVETGPKIPVTCEIIPDPVVIDYSELHSVDPPEVINLVSLDLEPPKPWECVPETEQTQEHQSADLQAPIEFNPGAKSIGVNHGLATNFVTGDPTASVSESIPEMIADPIAAALPEPSPKPVPVDSGAELDKLGPIEVDSQRTSVPMESVSEPKIVDPQLPIEADDLTQSAPVNSPEPQNIAIDSSLPLEEAEPVESTAIEGATVGSPQPVDTDLPATVENSVSVGILREIVDVNGCETVYVPIRTNSVAGTQPQTKETVVLSASVEIDSENQPAALVVNAAESPAISEEGLSTIETIRPPFPVTEGVTESAPVEPSEPVEPDSSSDWCESVPQTKIVNLNTPSIEIVQHENNQSIEVQDELLTASQWIPESESSAVDPQAAQPVAVNPLPDIEVVPDVVALEPPSLVETDPETQTTAIENPDPMEMIPKRLAEAESIAVENQINPEHLIAQHTISVEPQPTIAVDAIQAIENVQEIPCNTLDSKATTELPLEFSPPAELVDMGLPVSVEFPAQSESVKAVSLSGFVLDTQSLLLEQPEHVENAAHMQIEEMVSQSHVEIFPTTTEEFLRAESVVESVKPIPAEDEMQPIVYATAALQIASIQEECPQHSDTYTEHAEKDTAEPVPLGLDTQNVAVKRTTSLEETSTATDRASTELPVLTKMDYVTASPTAEEIETIEAIQMQSGTADATLPEETIAQDGTLEASEPPTSVDVKSQVNFYGTDSVAVVLPQFIEDKTRIKPIPMEVTLHLQVDPQSTGVEVKVPEPVDLNQESTPPKKGENPPETQSEFVHVEHTPHEEVLTESLEKDSQKSFDAVDLQEDSTEAEEKVDPLPTTEVAPDIIALSPSSPVELSTEIQAMTMAIRVPLEIVPEAESTVIEQPPHGEKLESILVDSEPVVIDQPVSAKVLFQDKVASTPQQIPENKSVGDLLNVSIGAESVTIEPITTADGVSEQNSRAVEPNPSTQATPVEVIAPEPFDTVVEPVTVVQSPTIEDTMPEEITQSVAMDSTGSLEIIQIDPKEPSAHVEIVSQIEACAGDPQESAKDTTPVEHDSVDQATEVSVTDIIAVESSVPVKQSEDFLGDPLESPQNVPYVVPVEVNQPAPEEISLNDFVAVELSDPVERTIDFLENTDFVAEAEPAGADNEIGVDPEINQLEKETLELNLTVLTMEKSTTIDAKQSVVLEPLVSVRTVCHAESTNKDRALPENLVSQEQSVPKSLPTNVTIQTQPTDLETQPSTKPMLETETVDAVEINPVSVDTSAVESSLETEKSGLKEESSDGEPLAAAESVTLEPPISVAEYPSVDSANCVPQLGSVPLSVPAAMRIQNESEDFDQEVFENPFPESVSCTEDLLEPAQVLLQEDPVDVEDRSGMLIVPDAYAHEFEPSSVEIVPQSADNDAIASLETNSKPETEAPTPMDATSTPDVQVVAYESQEFVPAAPVMLLEFVPENEHLTEESKDETAKIVSEPRCMPVDAEIVRGKPPIPVEIIQEEQLLSLGNNDPVEKDITSAPVEAPSDTVSIPTPEEPQFGEDNLKNDDVILKSVTANLDLSSDAQLATIDQESQEIAVDPATEGISKNTSVDSANGDCFALGKATHKYLRRQPNILDTPPSDADSPRRSEPVNLFGTICKFYIKDKRLQATIERRRRRSLIMHKYLSSFDSLGDSIDEVAYDSHSSLFEEPNDVSLDCFPDIQPPTGRAATPISEVDPIHIVGPAFETDKTETDEVDDLSVHTDRSEFIFNITNMHKCDLDSKIECDNLDSKETWTSPSIVSTENYDKSLDFQSKTYIAHDACSDIHASDRLDDHLKHLEDHATVGDNVILRLDMASQTSCDMADELEVEADSTIAFSLSEITYNFINEILFSDQLSSESIQSDESEPSTACETFNADGDSEQEFVSQRVLVLDDQRALNTNTCSNNTVHTHLLLPLTQTNNLTSGSRRTNGKLTNGSLRWSGSYAIELSNGGSSGAQPDDVADDDVVLLRRFVPGSIAEREVKKWYNAVEMPNNPYSPEALKQRISGTQERYMDVPNISPSAEQKALASALTENPDPPAPKTDYKRYSRDYYINNAPTATDSTGSGNAATTSAPEDVEDIVINEAQKASKPATEQDPPQESVHKATPVQVLDESLDSQSNPSLYSLQTTTTNTSDESDTVRIYDFNKQETTVIRAAPEEQQPSDSTTSSMESAQCASPSVSSSIDSSVSNKRERPVVLQFGPGDSVPTIGSPASTPTRGSTPPAFRFLQPKRRLIDPSQVLSVDEDDVPETTTPASEKPVIEDEVAHSMPSVKALAQAFLLTSKHTQPQRRWRAKVRIAAPPDTPDKPSTSLAKRHKLEHAVSMAEVADESTIASDLSSLETDPSIHSEANPPVASPASPVPVRHGFLRSNIAFFENLKFK